MVGWLAEGEERTGGYEMEEEEERGDEGLGKLFLGGVYVIGTRYEYLP